MRICAHVVAVYSQASGTFKQRMQVAHVRIKEARQCYAWVYEGDAWAHEGTAYAHEGGT